MKTRNLLLIGLTAAMLTGNLVYAETVSTETAPAETASEAEITGEKQVVLGEKTETSYEVSMTNATGRPVTAVQLKSNLDEDFKETLLEKDDVFEADETYILYCEKQSDEKKDLTYDLKITFTETESYVIHEIPFTDLKDSAMKICAQDGVAYLEYTDVKTDKEVNTKEAETKKRDEEAAAAPAAETVQETAAGTSESYYESNDYSYDYEESYDDYEDSYDYDYEDSYEDYGDDDSGQDACLDDGLMW